MAEYPPPPPPPPPPPSSPPPPPPPASNNSDPTEYWCYQCDKRVPVETRPDNPDIICFECKNGFVESISVAAHTRQASDEDTPAFGNEFLQVLRLIAQAAREDDEPPPPPSDHPAGDNDYLRIELDGWDNGNVNVNEDEDEDEEDPYQGDQARARFVVHDDDDDDVDEHEEEEEEEEEIENRNLEEEEDEQDFVRRERRDVLRLRLRDFASRAASRRNRILDWAEILMGLEDQSIEFRLQVPGDDDDVYVGNPGDYVDAAGYEALLQNLAENDTGGRRGAPPAAKSAVEALQTVEVNSTNMEICAICKDRVFNNEEKIAKQLQCGHMYHEDCIVPWLGSRNTCPICRYELPTDDPEYEEDRKKRSITMAASATDHGCSSSSGGDGGGD